MTNKNAKRKCHCEEQSDEAISNAADEIATLSFASLAMTLCVIFAF